MDSKVLYKQLMDAWSDENLNRISASLISLYKNKQYHSIRGIVNRIAEHVAIDEEKDSRCFSRLIMLYHPDRGDSCRKEIYKAYQSNDSEKLRAWSHILLLDNLDLRQNISIDPDIDYNPVYSWDYSPRSTGVYDHEDDNYVDYGSFTDAEPDVYNAIKLREYGDLTIELPSYYLEDLDELELAFQGLEVLNGIEFCVNLKALDLSHNAVYDLDLLWNLTMIEELYLSENDIENIDVLGNLHHLRILDLAGNNIEDVSPLFELEALSFVNLLGNPVEESQIAALQASGVIVLW